MKAFIFGLLILLGLCLPASAGVPYVVNLNGRATNTLLVTPTISGAVAGAPWANTNNPIFDVGNNFSPKVTFRTYGGGLFEWGTMSGTLALSNSVNQQSLRFNDGIEFRGNGFTDPRIVLGVTDGSGTFAGDVSARAFVVTGGLQASNLNISAGSNVTLSTNVNTLVISATGGTATNAVANLDGKGTNTFLLNPTISGTVTGAVDLVLVASNNMAITLTTNVTANGSTVTAAFSSTGQGGSSFPLTNNANFAGFSGTNIGSLAATGTITALSITLTGGKSNFIDGYLFLSEETNAPIGNGALYKSGGLPYWANSAGTNQIAMTNAPKFYGAQNTGPAFMSSGTGLNSEQYGFNASASFDRSISIGANAGDYGIEAITIGSGAAGGPYAVTIGSGATANDDGGEKSVSLGFNAYTTQTNSMALGSGSHAAQNNATAIGAFALTTRTNQIMLGTTNEQVIVPGSLIATGTVTAAQFAGDGSGLTNISATATNAIGNNNGTGTNATLVSTTTLASSGGIFIKLTNSSAAVTSAIPFSIEQSIGGNGGLGGTTNADVLSSWRWNNPQGVVAYTNAAALSLVYESEWQNYSGFSQSEYYWDWRSPSTVQGTNMNWRWFGFTPVWTRPDNYFTTADIYFTSDTLSLWNERVQPATPPIKFTMNTDGIGGQLDLNGNIYLSTNGAGASKLLLNGSQFQWSVPTGEPASSVVSGIDYNNNQGYKPHFYMFSTGTPKSMLLDFTNISLTASSLTMKVPMTVNDNLSVAGTVTATNGVIPQVKGAFSTNYTAVLANAVLCCTGTNQLITLPDAATMPVGKLFTVIAATTTGSAIVTNYNGSQTILGALSITVTSTNRLTVMSDGSNYW